MTNIDKIKHSSHQHRLKLKRSSASYKCNGCDELGFGKNYWCNKILFKCNFHLHEECALASAGGVKKHRFFEGNFIFHNYKSPVGRADCVKKHPFIKKMINFIFCNYKSLAEPPRFCVACGKHVGGFGYRSSCNEERVLHPYCLNLPAHIKIPSCLMKLPDNVCDQEINLNLSENTSSACLLCHKKRVLKGIKGWAYVSVCGKHRYHVACVKELELELWKNNYFDQQSTLSLGLPSEIIKTVIEVIIHVVLGNLTAPLLAGLLQN